MLGRLLRVLIARQVGWECVDGACALASIEAAVAAYEETLR